MSRGLKIAFLVHAIVALAFGIVLYLQPEVWASMTGWKPFDPHMTRIYGAALLALVVSSWFGYRATQWEEVRIVVLMEVVFTVLSTIGGLWAVLFLSAPLFTWVPIVIWVVFAAVWIYFYIQVPARAKVK